MRIFYQTTLFFMLACYCGCADDPAERQIFADPVGEYFGLSSDRKYQILQWLKQEADFKTEEMSLDFYTLVRAVNGDSANSEFRLECDKAWRNYVLSGDLLEAMHKYRKGYGNMVDLNITKETVQKRLWKAKKGDVIAALSSAYGLLPYFRPNGMMMGMNLDSHHLGEYPQARWHFVSPLGNSYEENWRESQRRLQEYGE